MKTQHLLRLLHQPHKIMPEDVSSLQALVHRYPYFQVAYTLLAKGTYDQDHVTAKQSIQLAAIHATDRAYLKALLEDNPPFTIPTLVPDETASPAEEEKVPVEDYDFINGYINAIRQRDEHPITKQKSLTQLRLIQDFMQKDMQFKPQPAMPDEDFQRDLTQQSTAFHDDLATENLAQVLVQQGKIARALEIYDQLLLKFPEKKTYFVPLIEELKSRL